MPPPRRDRSEARPCGGADGPPHPVRKPGAGPTGEDPMPCTGDGLMAPAMALMAIAPGWTAVGWDGTVPVADWSHAYADRRAW